MPLHTDYSIEIMEEILIEEVVVEQVPAENAPVEVTAEVVEAEFVEPEAVAAEVAGVCGQPAQRDGFARRPRTCRAPRSRSPDP